jgi:hypothetical protein
MNEQPSLKQQIAEAVMRYDRMTPAQRARHDHEQRRSFVRGCCPSNRDYGDWCAIVERLLSPIPRN